MALQDEIKKARKEIVSDGYEMSVGEIISLYKEKEIVIHPDFQRLFRWKPDQNTRFIESLLLGIPIPPIFVFQNEEGVWELIDGLQRLCTIFEFVGILRLPDGQIAPPLSLEGTRLLPSLSGKYWDSTSAEGNDDNGIGRINQFEMRRSHMRVEILRKNGDPSVKYKLFQRLNGGGSQLSGQEVRNCLAVMLNKPFFEWLEKCANHPAFVQTVPQTNQASRNQANTELALRFFAFRNIPYDGKLNVHEYLDDALIKIAREPLFSKENEGNIFERTFMLFSRSLGDKAFKKWDGEYFKGRFLMSLFEVMAIGVSKHIDQIEQMGQKEQDGFIVEKAKALWADETFCKYNKCQRFDTSVSPLANRRRIFEAVNKIRTLTQLQDFLDEESLWRVREIADLKHLVRSAESVRRDTMIRAGVPLLYAHWEGFVKNASLGYLNFVNNQRHRARFMFHRIRFEEETE